MKHKITLKEIKAFLQDKSNISNIGTKERTRFISDLRKSFCALANTFTTKTLTEIGSEIRPNFGHADVIYSLDKFNQLYPIGELTCQEIHNEAFRHFSEINGSFPLCSSDVNEVKKAYNLKMNRAINKFFLAIEKREEKIKKLENENKALKRKISLFNKTIFGAI